MASDIRGVVALFPTSKALLEAVPKVRAKGFDKLDAFTPHPVHGLDKALGLKRSPLPLLVIVMGLLGTALALVFQWWTSVVDYPLDIGGKALFSWQAFVPVMFEVTVLFATFTAGLGMLHLMARLPFFGHPVLSSEAIRAITKDRFALAIQGEAGLLDLEAAGRALVEAGAESVEVLRAPLQVPAADGRFWARTLVAIVFACAVSGYGVYWAIKLYPELPPMVHMGRQPKLMPQRADAFFKDGHGMQLPVEGAVARGHMPDLIQTPEEAGKILVNPLPTTKKVLERGRLLYQNHCQVCHDPLGTGHPMLTSAYGAKPADLQSSTIMAYPDGWIYHVVAAGKNAMPAYASDLSPDDRWAVVHYARALQRSMHAKEEDLR